MARGRRRKSVPKKSRSRVAVRSRSRIAVRKPARKSVTVSVRPADTLARSTKLKSALRERKKLAREYLTTRAGDDVRQRILKRIKARDKTIHEARRRIASREDQVAQTRERAKELRRYVRGYEAEAGFDLRRPKTWSAKQRARIERDWQRLKPVLTRPHVKARARTPEQLKKLQDFSGLKHFPKGMKAVPIISYRPEKTRVSVDKVTGEVVKREGRIRERFYLFNREEKALIKRTGNLMAAVRRLLGRMPAGRYMPVTGEAIAWRSGRLHDGPDSADDPENLLVRQIEEWMDEYEQEKVEEFLRGFKWIGTVDDDKAGRRERGRIEKILKERKRERKEARREREAKARAHALGQIPKDGPLTLGGMAIETLKLGRRKKRQTKRALLTGRQ